MIDLVWQSEIVEGVEKQYCSLPYNCEASIIKLVDGWLGIVTQGYRVWFRCKASDIEVVKDTILSDFNNTRNEIEYYYKKSANRG